ncbi:MAG: serine/threonine-protein kinase, partial [Myxococcota bacterium]
MDALQPGERLGRYRLLEPLGEGGMGSVWVAEQEGLGRRVALKVMRSEIAASVELAARFKREAQVAASFNHANIVPVTDFGVDGGRPFLVMDLLTGLPMNALLAREGRLPAKRCVHILLQVLDALELAHQAGVVHRDLKPDNVFITEAAGALDLARLLDFGIARIEEPGEARMTATGQVLGTPAYMAPEQAKGQRASEASDIYAAGVILYEGLSGRLPHSGENYHQLLFSIVGEEPTAIEELIELDPALVAVVRRAMHKDPSARYPSARAMADALAELEFVATRETSGASSAPKALAETLPSQDGLVDGLGATMPSQPRVADVALAATQASDP